WVTADSIYGGAYTLRHDLEEREQPFVLAVQSTQRVGLSAKAEQVVAAWPAEAWHRLSAGEGRQGPRWYDWAGYPWPGGYIPTVWPTGCLHAAVGASRMRSRTTSSLGQTPRRCSRWCRWRARAGKSSRRLNWPRARWVSMSMRGAGGWAGIGTSRWRC